MAHQSNTPNDKQLSIQDIIREIEQKSEGGGYIYRGEHDRSKSEKHDGKVSSSLWREYQIDNEHFDVELVQKELLAAAKKHKGDLPEDFRLDITNLPESGEESAEEFEILTDIQHYGGKTNLIDFTTDCFIALFFACDGQLDEDGRVILQKVDAIRKMIAHPRNPRHRVIVQKSVFVRPPRGFIEPLEDEVIIVPACLKEKILEHLRTYHGISTEVIYNDLHGFIRNQDIHGEAYTAFYKGIACGKKGDEATTSEEREQEYKKAIDHYTKAIRLKPDFANPYNNRGVTYGQKGDVDAAIQDYTKAIELNPDLVQAYNNRGVTYGRKGDVDAAVQDLNKAIELNPQYTEAYYNRGNAYDLKGDVDAAIQDFNKAIELNPQFTKAYNNRGNAYDLKGDVDAAVQDYTKTIELNPDLVQAYNNRGNTYRQKGEFDAAIQDYTKAIELNPDFAEAYNNRGITYGQKGGFDAAIQDLSKAIELNPQFTEAYNNRGVTYEQKGDVDAAIQDYTKAIELNPDLVQAYNNRGDAYRQKGEFDAAIQDLNKVIALNPQHVEAYNNRGVTYGRKGDVDAAVQDYTKAIELNPDLAEAYNNRGAAYGRKGDVDAAIQDYTKAIALNPQHATAYLNRGVVWLYLREWEKAKADLSDAKNMGADPVALFHRHYGSVEDLEQSTGIQLPADIVALLTPQ